MSAIPDNIDTKYGVNWKYLDSLLEKYNNMLEKYSVYVYSHQKSKYIDEVKINAVTAILNYYTAVKYSFDTWLNAMNNEKNIEQFGFKGVTVDDYMKLNATQIEHDQLQQLYMCIAYWSQSAGPFATLVEVRDPNMPDITFT